VVPSPQRGASVQLALQPPYAPVLFAVPRSQASFAVRVPSPQLLAQLVSGALKPWSVSV
jgi:hypothetical protein